MKPFIEQIFLNRALEDCRYAMEAAVKLNAALASSGNSNDVFYQIFQLLSHAACASRVFFPSVKASDETKRRCQHLREALGLPDKHPLRNRSLRNSLEHLDERLDAWVAESKNHVLASGLIGPRSAVVGLDDEDLLMHFDPETCVFSFRGTPYDIQQLVTGIEDVQQRISARLSVSIRGRDTA